MTSYDEVVETGARAREEATKNSPEVNLEIVKLLKGKKGEAEIDQRFSWSKEAKDISLVAGVLLARYSTYGSGIMDKCLDQATALARAAFRARMGARMSDTLKFDKLQEQYLAYESVHHDQTCTDLKCCDRKA